MIVHATVRVTGEPALLAPFRERLSALLEEEPLGGPVEEHHGEDFLHYDLKLEGGIPFPPFVAASGEFPPLTLAVDWVSGDGAARGAASIQNGRVLSQEAAEAAPAAGAGTFVSVDRGGRLEIALKARRVAAEEWRGYCACAERDALFRLTRDAAAGRAELSATDGEAPQWRLRWVVDLAAESFEERVLDPPEPVSEAEREELLALADAFSAEWLWFDSAPDEEVAVERQRCERLGFPARPANLRAARLASMARRKDGGHFASGLADGEHWIKEVLEQCWANNG